LAHQTPLSRRGFSPKSVSGISRPLHLDHFQCVTEDGKQRLLEHYQKSVAVPNYIRAALKALEKVCHEEPTEVVDGELVARERHEATPRPAVARNVRSEK
ncbi:hypothetical protein QOU05_19220, partial [Pseudomonas aeruginosa]